MENYCNLEQHQRIPWSMLPCRTERLRSANRVAACPLDHTQIAEQYGAAHGREAVPSRGGKGRRPLLKTLCTGANPNATLTDLVGLMETAFCR